jgi:hypothetical protein
MPITPGIWRLDLGGSQFEANLGKVSETLFQKTSQM